MTIRTNEEMRMFRDAIDRCQRTVWMVTPEGEQINLKTPAGCDRAIGKMLNAKDYEEPELFASCREDEMEILDFFNRYRHAA